MKASPSGHAPAEKAPHDAPPKPRSGSAVRLAILVGVLLILGGAWYYDYFVAAPGVKAADNKLHETVLLFNETGLLPGASAPENKGDRPSPGNTNRGMLFSEDIQKILGMSPTYKTETEFYTIEHYRWWGWVPLDKNYITVLYLGNPKKRHYATHYVNELPEDDALPGVRKEPPPVVLTADAAGAAATVAPGAPGAGGAGIPPGPPGAGGDKGKGKGRPTGKVKGDKQGAGANSDEPAKSDEPKKGDDSKSAPPSADSEKEKKDSAKEPTKEEAPPAKEEAKSPEDAK